MDINEPNNQKHDLRSVIKQYPDLSTATPADAETLKMLETKYTILLQIADQSLRDRELRLKEGAGRIDRWANPLVVGIFAGALGLVGTFINGLNSNNNEEVKLRNDLIKEAIKPSDVKERAKSLVFFAENGLIKLDTSTLRTLRAVFGNEQVVPGSPVVATTNINESYPQALPISFMQAIVNRIRETPGVPYPADIHPIAHPGDTTRRAIILHYASGDDNAVSILRNGRDDLPGPLSHWAVQSDGTIAFIAEETRQKVFHVGIADRKISNFNSISIETTGLTAFKNEHQIENLVRLAADVADRWNIPTNMILSHAEVALPRGRKSDMQQQAPIIRQMVDAVRKRQ